MYRIPSHAKPHRDTSARVQTHINVFRRMTRYDSFRSVGHRTTGWELIVTEAAPATRSRRPKEVAAKRRSGSENRRRTERKTLRLLPTEEEVLQRLADREGLENIQQYILLKFVEPTVAAHRDAGEEVDEAGESAIAAAT
jgi:hypothetical protein